VQFFMGRGAAAAVKRQAIIQIPMSKSFFGKPGGEALRAAGVDNDSKPSAPESSQSLATGLGG
jgi:hypothetical protein